MNNWLIETLGWTLLNSIWQIGATALILLSILKMLPNLSVNSRYLFSVSALFISLILPVSTFIYLSNSPQRPIKQNVQNVQNEQIKSTIQNSQVQPVIEQNEASTIISSENVSSTSSLKIPYLLILVSVWLIGIFIFSIRLFGGLWQVQKYKTQDILPVSREWQKTFDDLCRQLQITRSVNFLQSQIIDTPVVIGWLKPVVLVPASAFLQISPHELETILMHELTHIRRNDYLINLMQTVVEILFFFHPCVWWISFKIRQEREFAVDEFISQVFENRRFIYANALANLEEIRLNTNQTTPNLAMATNGGNLMKRIEKILGNNPKKSFTNVSIWSAAFSLCLIIGTISGIYWLSFSNVIKAKEKKKVAVIFSDMSSDYSQDPFYTKSFENLRELQNKFNIPATWVLGGKLIDAFDQNQISPDFFPEAIKNKSEFIVSVPNINFTVFMNGDEEYINLWKKRIQFLEENLSKQDYKLKYFNIANASQIPQEMDKYLMSRGLKPTKLPIFDFDFEFHFYYDKKCIILENKINCQDQNLDEQEKTRTKYLAYMKEKFELTSNYYKDSFGEEVPQILNVRAGNLTAASAEELLQMLQDNGYEFVPLEEVTSDEMYQKSLQPNIKSLELEKQKYKLREKYSDYYKSRPKMPRPNPVKDFKIDVEVKDLKIQKNQ